MEESVPIKSSVGVIQIDAVLRQNWLPSLFFNTTRF